jgi:hypothetical protein
MAKQAKSKRPKTVLNVELSPERDRKFRAKVAERLGLHKGNLKMAVESAIDNWIADPLMDAVEAFKHSDDPALRTVSANVISTHRRGFEVAFGIWGDLNVPEPVRKEARAIAERLQRRRMHPREAEMEDFLEEAVRDRFPHG